MRLLASLLALSATVSLEALASPAPIAAPDPNPGWVASHHSSSSHSSNAGSSKSGSSRTHKVTHHATGRHGNKHSGASFRQTLDNKNSVVNYAGVSFHPPGGHGSRLHGSKAHGKSGSSALPGCGFHLDKKQAAQAERAFKKAKAMNKAASVPPPTIPVYWHIVAANDTLEGGDIEDETIATHIASLNDAFEISGFTFELVDTTLSYNEEWFNTDWMELPPGEEEFPFEFQVKEKLHQGDVGTLNIYSTQLFGGTAGYAYLPIIVTEFPKADGVVVDWKTLQEPFDDFEQLGHALIHEVGHWLGLYHTFGEGGSCTGNGDFVRDTPPQRDISQVCVNPAPEAFCGNPPSAEVPSNYMDYAYGICDRDFTTGQIRRMREEAITYRTVANAPTPDDDSGSGGDVYEDED